MPANFKKYIFFAALLAVILTGVVRPSLFLLGNGTTTADGKARGAGDPLIVLPSLTAAAGSTGGGTGTGLAAAGTSTPRGVTPPTTLASEALVADLATGKTYFAKNADERWALASVSKLMTAVVATDLLGQNQHVTITEQMLAVDPSQQILQLGDTYTVSDLLHVMLLPSNNVAAEALAEFAGRARFLAAMNGRAEAWGMTNTYYDDPSGLSAGNQSTANDLLKLAQHVYTDYPQILAITRTPQVTVTEIATGRTTIVKSINQFAGTANFIGGKTGYTDEANGNLLSLFSYKDHPVFIVVLGTNDGYRFDGTEKLLDWLRANF